MKYPLILLILAVSLSVHAQKEAKPDSVENCITNWQKGETRTYTIVHEKKSGQQHQVQQITRFAYEAKVWVVDASDTDYTIRWVFHILPNANKEPQGQGDSLSFFEGMQMIFRISEMGSFIELVNWEEVRNSYSVLIEGANDFFKTRSAVESALIKEIRLFQLPYGYKYSTTKVNANTHLSNPYGGSPLPAIQSYQVTKVDPLQDQYTLVLHQHIDKENLNSWLDAWLKKMKIQDEKERQQKRAQLTALELTDHSEYRFIRSSGWIKHLSYERKAVADGLTQSDSYTIDLKD